MFAGAGNQNVCWLCRVEGSGCKEVDTVRGSIDVGRRSSSGSNVGTDGIATAHELSTTYDRKLDEPAFVSISGYR